jgi:hypothetical protein
VVVLVAVWPLVLAAAFWSLLGGGVVLAAAWLLALASVEGAAVADCAYAGVLELPLALALADVLLALFMSAGGFVLALGAVLFWAEASGEVLPFALLLGEVLAAELLGVFDDCMSLDVFAELAFEACGGFEAGGLLLGAVELGVFGLLPVVSEGFELLLVLELPIAPAAPVPLELELAEVQWSEIWRTSETWKVLPALADALVPPAAEVLALALGPPPLPVS